MSLQTLVGQFAANTGGATTTVSCGFQGKAILFWTHGKTTNPESAGASWAMGFADSAGHVFCNSWAGDDAVTTSNSGSTEQTGRALQILANGTPTAAIGGSISSVAFNSGNFVVTFNTTPSSAFLVNFILIGGSDITATFVGNSTTPASTTGVQHVTGVGFQGSVVFIILNQQTAIGVAGGSSTAFGVGVSTTQRFATAGVSQDAQTVAGNVRGSAVITDQKCMIQVSPTPSVSFAADFSGFTADGFDYNISVSSTNAYPFGYLVIQGGQWDAGVQAKPTTATTQTVTGESFQPSFLATFLNFGTVAGTATTPQESSFGATDGTNQVFSNAILLNTIATTCKSSGSASAMLLDRDGTNNPKATFVSFNSDGWSISWDATGTAKQVGWLAGGSNPVVVSSNPVMGFESDFQWLGGDWR